MELRETRNYGKMNITHKPAQVTDTPGLLDRPEGERNAMERLTLAALEHLPTAVLFVVDLTGECGTSVRDQWRIRCAHERQAQRFVGTEFCNKESCTRVFCTGLWGLGWKVWVLGYSSRALKGALSSPHEVMPYSTGNIFSLSVSVHKFTLRPKAFTFAHLQRCGPICNFVLTMFCYLRYQEQALGLENLSNETHLVDFNNKAKDTIRKEADTNRNFTGKSVIHCTEYVYFTLLAGLSSDSRARAAERI